MAAAAAVGGRSAYYGTEGGRAPKRLKTDGTDDNVAASVVREGPARRLSELYRALCGGLIHGLGGRGDYESQHALRAFCPGGVGVLCTMEGLAGILSIISHNMYSSLLLLLLLLGLPHISDEWLDQSRLCYCSHHPGVQG